MTLLPFFDSIDKIYKNAEYVILPDPMYQEEYQKTLGFLKSYTGSLGTFNSYRRETERLLQWAWRIKKLHVKTLKREDVEEYIRFCQNPPISWISLKKTPRFIEKEGFRIPNPEWRPFVAGVKKSARKRNQTPALSEFELSQGAVSEIFAILSTYFNFLIAEEYTTSNPVALIRQKSKFLRKRPQHAPVRRLSLVQWDAVMNAVEQLTNENPEHHERTRFILCILLGMYLRISELVASNRWVPMMNHFRKDSYGNWWFTTVGKGNKERQIAVSDEVLQCLTRYRLHLGLSPLPSAADNTPLIPKIRGSGAMADPVPIRRLVQICFDKAYDALKQQGLEEEADNLSAATVHWLRHTGISEDVKIRPREHVRDDAGHRSSITTDRYIDVEMRERHKTAKKKKIIA